MYRLFEKAMLWELIPLERNPIGLVELKGVSKRLKPPRILTEEEFAALLNQLGHPYRCMVLLAGCTGLRVSEVMGLSWSLLDFESLVMEVREGYARSQVTKLKSECFRDELPLDPDVATVLLEWKRLCPETEGDWVFPSPKPYDSGSHRRKVLKAAAVRAKIHGPIGGHSLRHSYRTWLDETGCPSQRATETYAPRQHRDHDEHLWRCLHGSEAQSQHISGAALAASRSHQIAKGRLVDGLWFCVSKLTGPFRTTIENLNSS
jgi:integrase